MGNNKRTATFMMPVELYSPEQLRQVIIDLRKQKDLTLDDVARGISAQAENGKTYTRQSIHYAETEESYRAERLRMAIFKYLTGKELKVTYRAS